MNATARIVLIVDVEYEYDAAGDATVASDAGHALVDHLIETWDGDDSIVKIQLGTTPVVCYDRKTDGYPYWEADQPQPPTPHEKDQYPTG
jgi:hypothetical protein